MTESQENKHSQCCAECHRAARKKIAELQTEIETINKCFGDGDREAFMKRYSETRREIAELRKKVRMLQNVSRAYVETNKRLCDRLARFKRRRAGR